jgi:hypothetical protein
LYKTIKDVAHCFYREFIPQLHELIEKGLKYGNAAEVECGLHIKLNKTFNYHYLSFGKKTQTTSNTCFTTLTVGNITHSTVLFTAHLPDFIGRKLYFVALDAAAHFNVHGTSPCGRFALL